MKPTSERLPANAAKAERRSHDARGGQASARLHRDGKSGEIGYVEVSGGARVRYLRVGSGPPLVLMHTVRTQLDHFQRVIPLITDAFTVYAIDFPGMGWSDIVPGASYEEPALRAESSGLSRI
jgi:hypothetical protein